MGLSRISFNAVNAAANFSVVQCIFCRGFIELSGEVMTALILAFLGRKGDQSRAALRSIRGALAECS